MRFNLQGSREVAARAEDEERARRTALEGEAPVGFAGSVVDLFADRVEQIAPAG